jgi:hypothetical protein
VTTTPNADHLQRALDHAIDQLGQLPDDAWGVPAAGLDWSCRETAGHILDDLGGYAMQLSGARGHGTHYTPLTEFEIAPGRPAFTFWPEVKGGTRAIADCLDAVGGLLVAVVAGVPADRVGWHPYGNPDRTALAAMGIAELTLHTFDILSAHGIDYAPPSDAVAETLDRIFPRAVRTDNPWTDLLTATGRTPESRGRGWRWDSSVT